MSEKDLIKSKSQISKENIIQKRENTNEIDENKKEDTKMFVINYFNSRVKGTKITSVDLF